MVVRMNVGGMVQDAMRLQNAGTGPHNRLVHMTEGEVDAMNKLAGIGGLHTNGMAVNPQTGLPEAGFFMDILPSLVGMGAMFIPGMQPVGAGLLAGGASMLTTGEGNPFKGDIGRSLLAGLGAWGGASLGATAGGAETLAETGATAEALGTDLTAKGLEAAAASPPSSLLPLPSGLEAAPLHSSVFPGERATAALSPLQPAERLAWLPGERATAALSRSKVPNLLSPGQQGVSSLVEQAGGREAAARAMEGATTSSEGLARLSEAAYLEDPSLSTAWKGLGRIDPFAWESSPGVIGLEDVAMPAAASVAGAAGPLGLLDPPETDWGPAGASRGSYAYQGPYLPRDRTAFAPPEGYETGVDPAYQYFSYANKGGYVGGLPTVRAQGGYGPRSSQFDGPPDAMNELAKLGIMQNPPSVDVRQQSGMRPRTYSMLPSLESRPLPTVKMQGLDVDPAVPMPDVGAVEVGGMPQGPVDIATAGLMQGVPPDGQSAVAERDAVPPSPEQPQNAEERMVFDQALLALQGQLEPELAQVAIMEFIETFGPEALQQLEALVSGERDGGGIVEPANGESTLGMTEEDVTAQQGPDVIPGKIVNPTTGRQTANLLIGQNEYVEPADSLSRRARFAGMPPTPRNGALVRGVEEDQLRQMYG